jgi:steroid 5-alpha reductase family enzyme
MSLPAVVSIPDCASFAQTVTPFLPQLSLSHFLPLVERKVSALDWYLNTNPLISAFAFANALAVVVLVLSEINRNYSQVDRLWSFLPTLYIAHYTAFAHLKGLPTERLDTLLTFSVLYTVGLAV